MSLEISLQLNLNLVSCLINGYNLPFFCVNAFAKKPKIIFPPTYFSWTGK